MLDQVFVFLDKILSASVVVALAIFVVKEFIEWSRRQKSKKSKERAYAHVLGREIKENLESIDYFFKIIDFILEHEECPDIKLEFNRLIHGYESCKIIAGRDSLEMQLPKFKTIWYEKLLVDLAEKDGRLSEFVSKAYDNIYFLSEKRNLIASFMAGELSSFLRLCAATTVAYLAPERERIEKELTDAYKALTGREKVFP